MIDWIHLKKTGGHGNLGFCQTASVCGCDTRDSETESAFHFLPSIGHKVGISSHSQVWNGSDLFLRQGQNPISILGTYRPLNLGQIKRDIKLWVVPGF